MSIAKGYSIIFLAIAVGLALADANLIAVGITTVLSTIWAAAAHVIKELK